jgi:F0F1-type ATP synthase epsilon subunit
VEIRILTPGGILWAGEVTKVSLPTTTGEIGILKDHSPLLTALEIGVVRFVPKDLTASDKFKTEIVKLDTPLGQWAPLFIGGGTAKVKGNIVQVISNKAVLGSRIDPDFVSTKLSSATSLVEGAKTKKEKITAAISLSEAKAYAKAASMTE